MSLQEGLQTLAARDEAAPFGFEMFEQRRARATARRRAVLWGSALSVVMLAMVGVIALLTQPDVTHPLLAAMPREVQAAAAAELRSPEPPALVDLGQFDVTSELEDRIALLDAELSVARVERVPPEQLRRIESTREQMNQSLQRVSYAHALLSL
jgi:hypothetical protein